MTALLSQTTYHKSATIAVFGVIGIVD